MSDAVTGRGDHTDTGPWVCDSVLLSWPPIGQDSPTMG